MEDLKVNNQKKREIMIKQVISHLKNPKYKTVYINIYHTKPRELIRFNRVNEKDPHVGIIAPDESIQERHDIIDGKLINILDRVVYTLNKVTNSNLDVCKVALQYIVEVNAILTTNEYTEFTEEY